ncbi:hypothetical protein [Microbacterium sp. JZ101]
MTSPRSQHLVDLAAARTCEHGWRTESRHPTSEGVVLYVRCTRCGARRVDLLAPGAVMPTAQTSSSRSTSVY